MSVLLVCAAASAMVAAFAAAELLVVGRATDAVEAALLVARHRPSVVVVDIDAATALDVVAAVGAAASAPPILAVSAVRADPVNRDGVLAAVRAGASGYLVAPNSLADLVRAVQRTAAGESVFSPGLAEVVLAAHGGDGSPAARLTDREADVLRLVVEGLTARQIATRLALSPRTVENHVQHVLRRLDLPNRAALVRYAIENGLA